MWPSVWLRPSLQRDRWTDTLAEMKTDKLFYAIFATLPDLVTELVEGIPPEAKYRFSAPVVKAQEFRLDGLLEPIEEGDRKSVV